jgi:predicted PurR-regulated permease PerM
MANASSSASLTSVAAVIGMVALTIYLLIVGQAIFIPLVLAIFITYLVVALAHALQKIRVKRRTLPFGWAVGAAVVLLILLLTGLVQLVADNIRDVVNAAPQYQARFEAMAAAANQALAATFNQQKPITMTTLLTQIDLRSVLGRVALAFQSIAANTAQILVYVAFMLLEVQTFDRKITAMFPDPEREASLRGTLHQIGHKIETYVWIKTAMSLLTSVLCFIALTVIGVDFAAFWALIIFVLNFIPYIGVIIAVVFPSLLALLQFGAIATGLLVFALLAGIQAFVDNVVEPRLAGKSLNISPIVMIVGLSVWGAVWGITGMVLSVPILVMVMIVLAQFPRTRPLAILMSQNGDIK